MQLYQLAIELDERSADVAERAVALGLGSVDPTSDLTQEQVSTLRAAYRKPDPAPDENRPVTVIGAASAPPPEEPRTDRSGRAKKVGVAAACVLALFGAVAFFAMQASPAEERQKSLSEDLAAWESAPPATVAPEVQEAALFPGDQPRDRAKLCAARTTMLAEETGSPETEINQQDWTEFRAWAADRTAWRAAMDEMIAAGPTDAVPDIRDYRDVREHYYAILAQAPDPQLRALVQGVELKDLDGYEKDVQDARDDMNFYLKPICG